MKPGPLKAGKLRIIAGAWRGRSIAAPDGDDVRPTAERVREALFNRLAHSFADQDFHLHGARVLDVFAGTGALGLEALSRGASHTTFLERDLAPLALIKRNVAKMGAEDRAVVLSMDATNLPRAAGPHDLALIDPPYGKDLAAPMLASLGRQAWLRPGALVSVETGADESLPAVEYFTVLDRRTYGRAAITFVIFGV